MPHGAVHSGAFCTAWVRDLEAAGGQPGCEVLACHNTEAGAEAKRLWFGSASHNSGLQNRAELTRSLAGWGTLRQPWCWQGLAAGCQVHAGSLLRAGSAPRACLLQLKNKITQKNRSPSNHSQPWSPTEAAGPHPWLQDTDLCFSAGEKLVAPPGTLWAHCDHCQQQDRGPLAPVHSICTPVCKELFASPPTSQL